MKNHNATSAKSRLKLLGCFFLGVFSLSVAVVLLVTDPVTIVARKYTQISPGSFVLEFFKQELEGAHLSVYIFNATNAEEFVSGKDYKLNMEEIGPFTFRETLIIENLKLDEEAGEMQYSTRFEPHFVLEESIGRPEDFNITIPNIPLLGLTSIASSYPYLIRMAYNILVRKEQCKPIITVNARNFIWGHPDPLLKYAKSLLPGLVNFDKLGILDQIYTQTKNDLVVGATEKDKFMIKTRNGYNRLMKSSLQDMKTCNNCDIFENTYEGMMYPSPVQPETPVRLFRNGFCRILDLVFQEKRILDNGVEGLVFQLDNNFFSNGLMDMSDCLHGLPISLSKVNFVDVDPELYERIDGMKRNPDKFNSYFIIEPITGVQIDTDAEIQVNLKLSDLSFNSESRRFSNMLVPICYSKVKQPELPGSISSVLKFLYVSLPLILLFTIIVLVLTSFILIGYSMRLLYCRKFPNSPSFPTSTKFDDKADKIKVAVPLLTN